MYTIDHVIKEVKNYLIYQDNLIIQNKSNKLFTENEMISEFGTDPEIWNMFLVFNDNQNNSVFVNQQSGESYNYPKISAINTQSPHKAKFGVNESENLIHFKLKDGVPDPETLSVQYNWEMISTLSPEYCFLWNDSSVKALINDSVIWQSDFSTLGKVRKVLGSLGKLLWLSIENSGSKKVSLVAIDTDTGQLIKSISDDDLPIHPVHVELIPEKQTILSIWGKISSNSKAESPLVEINALTGEVIRNTHSSALLEENLKLGLWSYLDGKIYFDAAFDTINSTHIGVMDYETLELEWFTEVKDRKAGLRNLMVTENIIYIMDSGNQLFIYVKES